MGKFTFAITVAFPAVALVLYLIHISGLSRLVVQYTLTDIETFWFVITSYLLLCIVGILTIPSRK